MRPALRFAGLWAERLGRTAAPNVNTPLEAVSGIVGAVGVVKGNGKHNDTTGRVEARCSDGICGELSPDGALVGAVCDLAWLRTLPKVLLEHAVVEGNLVYLPSSPSLPLVGRQSENGPYDCLGITSAPKR